MPIVEFTLGVPVKRGGPVLVEDVEDVVVVLESDEEEENEVVVAKMC